ncbi:MAG: hypothetical protein JNL48_22345 [Acidobacteria bacterium]|nr:hypothetical protein [Acidobacteriota bacterium]
MSPLVACVVCARPFDSLLTSGLHAGVAVMALVALVVIGALVRGALAIARQDAALARSSADAVHPEVTP